jgi:hypothetical protein
MLWQQLVFSRQSNKKREDFPMKKLLHSIGMWLGGLVCFTWLVPIQVVAAETQSRSVAVAPVQPIIRDIALGKNGSLTGQLVDAQGHGRPNQPVVIQRQGAEPRKIQTDQEGRFSVSGLTGGTYQVATVDSAALCRCWTEKVAPPAARKDVLLVSGEGIQRGQYPFGEMLFSAPVLIALVIAAAIAIPIAVHNSQDAS